MNNRWMRSFLLIAEKGSISQAAAALYISPVALHQQLNLMEESLGFKLFVRSRKGVALTPAGEEFRKGPPSWTRSTALPSGAAGSLRRRRASASRSKATSLSRP